MTFKLADRVKETTITTGSGTINLGGTTSGFQTFVSGIGTGNTTCYGVRSGDGSGWEVGIGTVTAGSPDTLTRTTILASSSGGTAINLFGTSTVFCTDPGNKSTLFDQLFGSGRGGILLRNNTIWTALAAGTLNRLLKSGDATHDAAWGNVGDDGSRITYGAYNYQQQVTAPANPAGTTSTAVFVMAGLAVSFTPRTSGILEVIVVGRFYNSVANDGMALGLNYGTGTAPVNGAALTGTQFGNSPQNTFSVAGVGYPVSLIGQISGLTLNTAYWFDLRQAAITGGTATVDQLYFTIKELP